MCQWLMSELTKGLEADVVEIILNSYLETAHVVHKSDSVIEVHISTGMHIDVIKDQISGELTAVDLRKFEQLWGDDNYPRKYVQGENYLKIMSKE